MADYAALRLLFTDNDLRNRIDVAIIVEAEAIRGEDAGTENHANRLAWAKAAFANPRGKSDEMLMALLAANKDATVNAIQDAGDEALQAKVSAAVNVFADGS